MASNTSLAPHSIAGAPANTVLDKAKGLDVVVACSNQFPEGGTAGWCTVIGAVLMQICGFGYSAAFGVYQDFYTRHYLTDESSSVISWIGSANAFIMTSFSVVAGILYDRGYFYHLIIGGSLLESFFLFMLSLAQPGQYYQVCHFTKILYHVAHPTNMKPHIFLAQGIGLGIAQGLIYIPTFTVVAHYFQQRRTLAMSLVACGSSIGSITRPITLNYLLNQDVGFTNGVRISAAFVSAMLLIACLLMRTRLDPPEHRINYLTVCRAICRDAAFWFMSVGMLLFQIGFYYPLFYFQLDSVKHKNSEEFSFYSLVLLNGGSLIGRLSAGFIAHHVGVPMLTIAVTATCSIIILSMIGLGSVPTVVVLGTLYGYLPDIAMMAPLMALLTTDFSELGARMGIGITIIEVGALLGGPIAGALLTSQYKWWQPSLSAGLIALTGSLLLVVMQLLLARRQKILTGR